MRTLVVIVAACVTLAFSASAGAQQPRRLPIVVFDIRGFYSKLGQDPVTAGDLHIEPTDLPARGLGGVAGIHIYPLRMKKMALGIGAEGIIARAHRELKAGEDDVLDPETSVLSQPVDQRLRGLSGVLSLNFGHRDGWSYVSAGLGPMSFISYMGGTIPAEPRPVTNTLNFGGGARWFMKTHVAFCFDVRFYQTRPELRTPPYPGRQRSKLLVMSAGVAIK